MPGGDDREAGASDTANAAVSARRGPDRGALLAWTLAVVLALVVAGFAIIGVRAIVAQRQVFSHWWDTVIAEADARDALPYVEPLSGPPLPQSPVAVADTRPIRGGAVVVNPSWVSVPRSRYPGVARREGIKRGQVDLRCPVSVEGRIASCWILREAPAGAGFGQAAVAGAAQSRLQPRTVDGVAGESVVSFTVKFEL
tara:strand:- start:350 stop:943 length:594 start_codon:yes stop_codon:yes gene_type:complete